MRGTVRSWWPSRGFGFIAPEDGSADIFVHANECKKSGLFGGLAVGDFVEFTISKRSDGRRQAICIRLDHAEDQT
jgi:CspA family cold shock protein